MLLAVMSGSLIGRLEKHFNFPDNKKGRCSFVIFLLHLLLILFFFLFSLFPGHLQLSFLRNTIRKIQIYQPTRSASVLREKPYGPPLSSVCWSISINTSTSTRFISLTLARPLPAIAASSNRARASNAPCATDTPHDGR